jgi:hypothetical protein
VPDTAVVTAGSAAGLAAIDVYYAGKGRISPIYLLDALEEILFLLVFARFRPRKRPEGAATSART